MLIHSSCLFSYECKTCPGNWNNDTNVVNIGDCSYIIAFKYIDCFCPSDTCRREMQINSIRSLVPACNTVNSDSLMNFSVRRLLQIAHSVFGVPDPGVSEYKITISNPSCFRRNLDTLLPCEQSECCGRYYTMILEDGEPIVKAIDPDTVAPYNCFGLIGGPCGTHLCSSQMVPLNLPLFYVREDCDHDNCYWRLDGNYVQNFTHIFGTKDNYPVNFIINDKPIMKLTDIGLGLYNDDPKDALQIGPRLNFHISGWNPQNPGIPNGDDFFSFNEYIDQYEYKRRIFTGYTYCLRFCSNGTLFLANTGFGNKDDIVDYNETSGGFKGITIQTENNKGKIGIGGLPENNVRLSIRSMGEESTPLKVLNHEGDPIFKVDNDGKLCAKDIWIQLSGSPCWPDYVFNDKYELLPLNELEKKIKDLRHLPGLPSRKDVEENGIDIGEMQMILIKKIEELTLYAIQLNKELEELKKYLKK